jgi:hypothetical protein
MGRIPWQTIVKPPRDQRGPPKLRNYDQPRDILFGSCPVRTGRTPWAVMARSEREIPHDDNSITIDMQLAVSRPEEEGAERPVSERLPPDSGC